MIFAQFPFNVPDLSLSDEERIKALEQVAATSLNASVFNFVVTGSHSNTDLHSADHCYQC